MIDGHMTDREIELFAKALAEPEGSIYGFSKEEKARIMEWLKGDSAFLRVAERRIKIE